METGQLGGVFESPIPEWAYQDNTEYYVYGITSPTTTQTKSVDHIVKYGNRLFLMGIYKKTSSSPYYIIINAMEYFPDSNTLGEHKRLQIDVRGEHTRSIGTDNGIYLLALDRNTTSTYKYDYDTNTAVKVSTYPYLDSYDKPDAYGMTEFFDREDGDSIYAHQNNKLYKFSTSLNTWTELPENTAFVRNDSYTLKFAGICRLSSINSIIVSGGYWYNDASELYNFDLSTQTWTYRCNGNCQGSCFISSYPNGDTFVGLGHTQLFNDYPLTSSYSYTASTNTWTDLLSLPNKSIGGTSPQVTIKDTVFRMYDNKVLLYVNKGFY